MRKKSQVQQLFFYLIALFVIGATLILGVNYIVKLTKQVDAIDIVKFKVALEDDSEMLSTKYGSWREKSYHVPKEIKEVCFFDIDSKKRQQICSQLTEPLTPIMCDAWTSGTQNVMTVPFVLDTTINLTGIKITDTNGFHCFTVRDNTITVILTGLGNGVQISDPITDTA